MDTNIIILSYQIWFYQRYDVFFANEIAILKSHDFYHPSHFEHIAGLLKVEVIYPIASWIRIDLRISIITALWVCFHLFYRNMLRKCFRNQGNPDLVWWSIDQLVWWEVSSQKLPTIFFTFWLRGTWNVIIVWKYLGNETIYRRRSQELTCCLLGTKHTHKQPHNRGTCHKCRYYTARSNASSNDSEGG